MGPLQRNHGLSCVSGPISHSASRNKSIVRVGVSGVAGARRARRRRGLRIHDPPAFCYITRPAASAGHEAECSSNPAVAWLAAEYACVRGVLASVSGARRRGPGVACFERNEHSDATQASRGWRRGMDCGRDSKARAVDTAASSCREARGGPVDFVMSSGLDSSPARRT